MIKANDTGSRDQDMDSIIRVFEPYKAIHRDADIQVQRINDVILRIRVIDPDLRQKGPGERENELWRHLNTLPESIVSQITMVLALAPEEALDSHANFDFEHPLKLFSAKPTERDTLEMDRHMNPPRENVSIDQVTAAIIRAFDPYKAHHPQADIQVRRKYDWALLVRVIDPDLTKKDLIERDNELWKYLETLPDSVIAHITMVIPLTPDEAPDSGANHEFEFAEAV